MSAFLWACGSDSTDPESPPGSAGANAAGTSAAGAGGSEIGGTDAGGSGVGGAAGSEASGGSAPVPSGSFVAYCLSTLASGDTGLTLRFKADLAEESGAMALSLTPLKTSGTSLSDTTGATYKGTSPLTSGGAFSLSLGEVEIPGAANAISGSDITLSSTKLVGAVQSPDRLCAELDALLSKPFSYDLTTPGDVCLILRAPGDGSVPATPSAAEFSCSGQGGAGGAAGAAGSGGSGQAGSDAGAGGSEAGAGGSDAGAGGSDAGAGGSDAGSGQGGSDSGGAAGAGGSGQAGQSGAGQGGAGGSGQGGSGGAPVCPPTEFPPLSQCDSPTKSSCAACFCADDGTATDCKAKWEACLADEGCSKAVACSNQGCSTAQCASVAGSGLSKALAVKNCREKVCPQACSSNGGG